MGGMTCAALLAELGERVLVLEHHYVPGGFTQTFTRKGWHWDVGVHAVGEVDERALLGRVLAALTGGRLAWTSLGAVYDRFDFPDLQIDFSSDRQAFLDALLTAFPGQRQALAEYGRLTRLVSGSMRRYYMSRLVGSGLAPLADRLLAGEAHRFLQKTTEETLSACVPDERLRRVLTSQWGYYGSPPARSSFAIHALVARHFQHGGYYPIGGSARIAVELLQTVQDQGGATRIRADVERIVVEGGRAVGVQLRDGEELRARRVVSAAGARATVTRLLPESEQRAAWAQSIAALPQSPAHVCLYLGFRGDIRQAGAGAANRWFYETWRSDEEAWHPDRPGEDAPVLYCSFPSLKDPHHDPGPKELHTGEVVTFVPDALTARFQKARWRRRGDEYEALKKDWSDRLLAQLLRHMPRLGPHVDWVELSTPATTETFTRAPQGAIYGLEPTPARYANRYLRPRTPVPGLFLAGGDMASVGVMGAMVGGLLCAAAMEPRRAFSYLRRALR
jgi:all-trans-retinol 13,14-reductase